jgi:glycolate oxidase FAD binding subunit
MARQKMGGEEFGHGDAAYWNGLREQTDTYFSSLPANTALWRLSVPTYAPPLDLPGEQLIEWGGAQRWLKTTLDTNALRSAAAQAGGHATLFRHGDKRAGVFHPLAPAVLRIHRNLKATFDPAGIFNPGRMYEEF